jgi:hypothetical protein
MRWLLIILFPVLVWADAGPIPDQLLPENIYLYDNYPANGATGVETDQTVWLKVYTADTSGGDTVQYRPSDLAGRLWMLSIAGDQDTIQQMDTMSSDRWELTITDASDSLPMDCVIFTPLTDFRNYVDIWVKINGEPSLDGVDSFYFRTIGASSPFTVIPSGSSSWLDTVATGNKTVTIFRPAGSTIYASVGGSVSTLASPSSDYATEWKSLSSTATITGIPQGNTRVYFWCVSAESDASDSTSNLFFYRRLNLRTSPDVRWW